MLILSSQSHPFNAERYDAMRRDFGDEIAEGVRLQFIGRSMPGGDWPWPHDEEPDPRSDKALDRLQEHNWSGVHRDWLPTVSICLLTLFAGLGFAWLLSVTLNLPEGQIPIAGGAMALALLAQLYGQYRGWL